MDSIIKIQHPFSTSNNYLKQVLKDFQTIIKSSIGPYSKCKLIKINNKIGNSSKLLVENIYKTKDDNDDYLKWLFNLIKETIESNILKNYNSNKLTCYLINEFILFKLYQNNKQNSLNYLTDIILNELIRHLTSDDCLIKYKIDLNNLLFISNLVKTQLLNKQSIKYNTNNYDGNCNLFINLLLKAFISSVDDKLNKFSSIYYLFDTQNDFNLNDSKLLNGLLIELQDTNNLPSIKRVIDVLKSRQLPFKCVLFDCNLSGDFEFIDLNEFKFELECGSSNNNRLIYLNKLIDLCNYLIQKQVNFVFCQKVIHPSVKCFLLNNNIIPIDRLSIVNLTPVVNLSNAKICSSIFDTRLFDDNSIYGYLDDLSIVKLNNDKLYFHLNSFGNSKVQTIIVQLKDDLFIEEVEFYLKTSELCFRRAIISGYAFSGSACFYSYLICYLVKFVCLNLSQLKLNKVELNEFVHWFKHVLIGYLKNLLKNVSNNEYYIDTKSGHLFLTTRNDKCICGSMEFNEYFSNIKRIFIDDLFSENIFLFDINQFLIDRSDVLPNLIDCYESKVITLKTTRDLLLNIFQVTTILSD